MITQWTTDLRHAWRALLRTPGFFVTSVGTLALAIGAVAGMFSVVNTVLLKPLPFPASDRLVVISGTAPGSDLPERFGPGLEFYVHYKERSKLLDGVFIFGGGTSTLRTENRVERIPMGFPSIEMYATLGVRPQLGRLPVAEDADRVVVISDQLWSSWFNRDPSVIGRSYYVSDGMREVIGIMPAEFRFPNDNTLLWVPNQVRLDQIRPGNFGLPVIARMRAGITRDQLATELTQLSKELPGRFGGPPNYARIIERHSALVDPLLDRMVGPAVGTSLWVLLGAVSIVLIIACANVTNLFLVRAEGRRRDMAVRRAIGASRTQLVRLQMAEAFLVALPAGILAVLISTLTLPLFLRAAPVGIPRLSQSGLDLPTLGAAFGLVVLTALLCGALPALRASSPDLTRLRDAWRSTGRHHWGRNLLVVGQTALALVLLIGSALLVQSFQRLRHVDPGYDTRDIYTFQFAPDQPHLVDGPSWGRLHLMFMDRLRALPGVTAVGVVNNIPLDEGTETWRFLTDAMTQDSGGTMLDINFTGGDYFRAMGIALLQGRAFTNDEAVTPNSNVVVSRTAAERLWPGQSPLGQRIRRAGSPGLGSFTVVGVVEDVKQNDWRDAGESAVYFPLTGPVAQAWGMGSPAYVVRSPRADSLQREVRDLVRQVAPEAPVYRDFTMEFLTQRSMIMLSFTMLTLGVVSGLALILGAVGLYGVLSYVVAERTREIGVRMALGATAGAVRRMVMSQGAKVVLAGLVLGVGAALASTRLLSTLLFNVKAVDPVVFAAMALVMTAIGMLASYMPARRASKVDPMQSLRGD